jgi:Zn-finger nucleic acid-binding protein
MLCPTCKIALVMAERQGIEIDYCPTCRGIWLDRGELDKIIERAAVADRGPRPENPPAQGRETHTPPPSFLPRQPHHSSAWRGGDHDDDHRHREHGHQEHHGKKRKSFLSDIFDFD